jgi:hypothetical protein
MSKLCPYCKKELKDDARFCIGCGRQLGGESVDVASTALSDLKVCYGTFPASRMECYLCADEEKCASCTNAEQVSELISKINALMDSLDQSNAIMVEGFNNLLEILRLLNSNIVTMNSNICNMRR